MHHGNKVIERDGLKISDHTDWYVFYMHKKSHKGKLCYKMRKRIEKQRGKFAYNSINVFDIITE